MEKIIFVFALVLLILTLGNSQTQDSIVNKKYHYELNWGFTSNKPFSKAPFKLIQPDMNLSQEIHPFNNRFSLKFGIENNKNKIEVGYYTFFNEIQKRNTKVNLDHFFANGIEINYYSKKYAKESKRFRSIPYLGYGLNLGAYNGKSHTIHRIGIGGEFDIKIYKGLYLRNNTSINYLTHGFPMMLLSQFYIGVRF